MRNNAPNVVENLVPDPFLIVCLSQGLPKHIESKVLFTFTLYKAYLKKGLELVSLFHFLQDF